MFREYDLVIFGFTGFTGYFVLRELLLSIRDNPDLKSIKWAIAGRNEKKIIEGLEKLKKEIDFDVNSVAKIIADVSNFDSLFQMAKQTRLVINTVGPYRFYGRPVVEACVNAGTHHIDISGEPSYIEQCALDFNQTATDNGTLIISTCGWDSIPCDLGVDFLKSKFNGSLHSVETYMSTKTGPQVSLIHDLSLLFNNFFLLKGYKINFGTFQSAMYGFAFGQRELKPIRTRLFHEIFIRKLPISRLKLSRRILPFTSDDVSGWNVVFPGSDRSVVKRTQYHNFYEYNERPTQIETYFNLPNLLAMFGLMLVASVFGFFSLFAWGRSLLEKYPEIFTFGMFSKNGPSREQIDNTKFRLTLVGKGWSKKMDDPQTEPDGDLDKKVIAQVEGKDPGYVATSTCLIQAGLTILLDRDQMPKGGVLTPGYAFRKTKLFERLQARDLKFSIKE